MYRFPVPNTPAGLFVYIYTHLLSLESTAQSHSHAKRPLNTIAKTPEMISQKTSEACQNRKGPDTHSKLTLTESFLEKFRSQSKKVTLKNK